MCDVRLRDEGSQSGEVNGRGTNAKHAMANFFLFCLMAAWLNEVVVRAVALLSALTKEFTMHIIL